MKRLHTILITVFGALLLAGAFLRTFDLPFAEWVFLAGALLAVVQSFVFAMQNKTDDRRESRLHLLNFVASLFLGVAAWMMWVDSNSWVVMLLCYVVVVLFLSFRGKGK